jgi:hypothetical protein
MYIIPPFKSIGKNVLSLSEFRFAKRIILIYWDKRDVSNTQKIAIINNSLQAGSISQKLSNHEILASSNAYYGTVENALIFDLNNLDYKKATLNKDALIFIGSMSYLNKHYCTINDHEKTINTFSGAYKHDWNQYFFLKDNDIMPSDVRFYNMDHQEEVFRNDNPFATYDRFNSSAAKGYKGFPYTMDELIDPNTEVKIIESVFDLPSDVLGGILVNNESDLLSCLPNDYHFTTKLNVREWIFGFISRMINAGILAFFGRFEVIIDSEYGYNVKDVIYSQPLSRKLRVFEEASFYTQLENEWEKLCDYGYNIRVTLRFDHFKTNIQILPLPKGQKMKPIKTQVETNNLMEVVHDNLCSE